MLQLPARESKRDQQPLNIIKLLLMKVPLAEQAESLCSPELAVKFGGDIQKHSRMVVTLVNIKHYKRTLKQIQMLQII